MSDPVLNLDTLIRRPTIDIDGARYEILSPDELSVLENRRFALWTQDLEQAQKQDGDPPELEQLVTEFARKVLVGVPDEVFAKLSGQHKTAVVEVFTGLLLRRRMSVTGAIGTAIGGAGGMSQLPGASSFPGFNGSMGGRRASGWRKLLSLLSPRTPG